jgi:hypothetical protein
LSKKHLTVLSSIVAALVLATAVFGGSATASPSPTLLRASSAPNVVGLKLPAAETRLRSAGFTPRPFNTDTLFGIVVARHYTVCHQWAPVGTTVKILAQKYGC